MQHVLLRDLNVEPHRCDEQRVEVIANGLLPSGTELMLQMGRRWFLR